MSAPWHILNKVLVKQFYQQNAGMFLMAFLFLFGIVDAGHLVSYHTSLLLSITSLPLFLWIVMLFWLLYNIKCIAFCITHINSIDGNFLFQLRALSNSKQWLLYLLVSISLYMPVLVYSIVLAVFAFSINAAVTWQVAAWQFLMVFVTTLILFTAINSNKELAIIRWMAALKKIFSVKTGYYAFSLGYLLNEKKAAFAVVKIFSLLVLGMLLVRNADSFDADLFMIFYFIVIAAHASLVMYIVSFNETLLHTNRNLSMHWSKTAMMYIITWAILMLPETIFMLLNHHGNIAYWQIAALILAAIAALFLFTGIALACGLNSESYLLFVFMTYVVLFFLQKATGIAVTAVSIAVLAAMVFKAHYYSFEKEPPK